MGYLPLEDFLLVLFCRVPPRPSSSWHLLAPLTVQVEVALNDDDYDLRWYELYLYRTGSVTTVVGCRYNVRATMDGLPKSDWYMVGE